MFVDFHDRSPVSPSDADVVLGVGVVAEQATFESRKSLLPDLAFQLVEGQHMMRTEGTHGFDSLIRHTASVETIHDLRKHEMGGCRPLQIVKEQHRFHSGATQVLDPS